jgi:hypothetical protein
MVKLEQVREGSIVIVRGEFGHGHPKKAVVTEAEENIKNGHPGISYSLIEDPEDGGWAYMCQIDSVITY